MTAGELVTAQAGPYDSDMHKRTLLREVNRAFQRSTRHVHRPMYPSCMPAHGSMVVPSLIAGLAVVALMMAVWWLFG